MTEKEIRSLSTDFEVTDDEWISGYALKFNRWSDDLGFFREIISPDALRDADMSNVVALVNHDESKILGRTGINVELHVDDIGLKFKVKPTNTSYARDLVENMKENIINQCSFAMSDIESEWEDRGDDSPFERTITRIGKLWDVSVVTTPAYPDTNAIVGARSKEKVKEMMEIREKPTDTAINRRNELRKKLLESQIKGGNINE